MRLIDADGLRKRAIEKLHMVNSLSNVIDLIDDTPTIKPSADRPKYNLELIRDIVRELGHLDNYIADTYLRPNNKIHIQFENIFSDDCYFIEDDKYILAELEKIATNTEDCIEFTLTNNKKVIIHSADKPKGKWIGVTNGRGGHECSNCHAYAPSYMSGDEHLSDFCPNCGTDMRKE